MEYIKSGSHGFMSTLSRVVHHSSVLVRFLLDILSSLLDLLSAFLSSIFCFVGSPAEPTRSGSLRFLQLLFRVVAGVD